MTEAETPTPAESQVAQSADTPDADNREGSGKYQDPSALEVI